MPKFCVAINYYQLHSQIVLPFVCLIFLPGDTGEKASIEFGTTEEVNNQLLQQKRQEAADAGLDPKYAAFRTQIGLTNLTITQPGAIKVRVRRGDQLVRLGSIRVAAAPQPALQSQQEPPSFALSP